MLLKMQIYFTEHFVTSNRVPKPATPPAVQWLLYSCLISSVTVWTSWGPGLWDRSDSKSSFPNPEEKCHCGQNATAALTCAPKWFQSLNQLTFKDGPLGRYCTLFFKSKLDIYYQQMSTAILVYYITENNVISWNNKSWKLTFLIENFNLCPLAVSSI